MEGPLPAGFRRAGGPRHWIVFDETLAEDLDALCWLGADGAWRGARGAGGAAGRGETARVELPRSGATLMVRPVLHGGLFGRWLRGALPTPARAATELRVTAALHAAGAPVPRPALAAARRSGPVWQACVATFFEADAPDVLAWLAGDPSAERVEAAARACARAIRRFHDAGGTHADLHVKNLLVRERAGGTEAVLVDLDGAGFGEPPGPARRMRELARLYRSGLKRGVARRLEPGGYQAFLSAYVGGNVTLGTALARHWPRERRRVALHALGYRPPEGRAE